MAEAIERHEWASTPIGAANRWPESLRTLLRACLHSPLPTAICWGEELTSLCNDDFARLPGIRAAALGRPAPELFAAAWPAVGALVEAARRGQPAAGGRIRLPPRGEDTETWYSFACAPLFDGGGGVAGVQCTARDETEQVRLENSLASAQDRSAAALFAGEVGTFVWEIAGDRLWGDTNFARMFGVELDVSGAAPLSAYLAAVHPDEREDVQRAIERTLSSGVEYEAEYTVITGAEPRRVVARGKVERDDAGRAVRFPGVIIDVTGRRKAEDALRASEARYRTLFESIDEGFCVLQVIFDGDRPVDYRFIEMNQAFEAHTGLQDALGRTAREVLPGLEEHWFEIYGRVAVTGEPSRFESGSDVMGRWFDVFAFRVEAPEERKVALLFKDISEARRAERLVHESRERFLAILENSLDAAYRRDLRTDSYDYLSPSVEQVLGITADEMRHMNVAALVARIHPGDRDSVWRAIEAGVREGGGRIEYRFRAADDGYRYLADHFTVQKGNDGTPLFRTGIVRDVTEQKLAEQALRAARDEAEAASLAKSQFLAVMSHELRTPLSGIVGFTDLLETEVLGPATARQKEALARIRAGSWHLIGIIDDILTLSRAEAGKEEIRIEQVDLAELTREVVRIVEPHPPLEDLVIRTRGMDHRVPVTTDPVKVRQILMNLLGNAVKYAPRGTITVDLDDSAAELVRVHVRDTGPGIPPSDHERIFEPFTQVDSSLTGRGAGVGLGLAICRRMARLMGGDVELQSEEGAGSTFTLLLPRG